MNVLQTSAKWQRNDVASGTYTENMTSNFAGGKDVLVVAVNYHGLTWASGSKINSVTVGGVALSTPDLRYSDSSDVNHITFWLARNVPSGRSDVVFNVTGIPNHYYTAAAIEMDDLDAVSPIDANGNTGGNVTGTSIPVPITTVAAATRVVAGFFDTVGIDFTSITNPAGATTVFQDSAGNLHMSGGAAWNDETTAGAKTPTFTVGASNTFRGAAISLKLAAQGPGNSGIAVDFVGDTHNPLQTSAFDTASLGTMIAAVGRGVLADFSTTNVTDNQGNGNYTQLGTEHNYTLWTNSGTAVYAKTNALGGTGTVVQTTKPSLSDEVTLLALHVRGVDNVRDVQWVEDLTSPNTSASVTLPGAGVLVAIWAGDNSNGELNPGIETGWVKHQWTSSLASNHVQMAIATRIVSTGGTYTVDWTPTTSQGAQLWLIALDAGGSISQFSPSADVQIAGWTPTPAGAIFDTLNEADTPSDADYVTSPLLRSAAELCIMALSSSMAAGNYTVSVRAATTSGTGNLRARFLDASGADVGVTALQAITSTLTTYSLSVTLTGTATQVQLEVTT